MKELKNKIVFITGASSGIGRACAEEFAKAGSNLILCARRIERLTELKKSLVRKFKVKIFIAQLDVRKLRDVKKVVSSLPDQWKIRRQSICKAEPFSIS